MRSSSKENSVSSFFCAALLLVLISAARLDAACPSILVNPLSLPPGVTGTNYSQSLTQTGGGAGALFSVGGGALPNGVSLNVSNGALTGPPTVAGSFSFLALASDSFTGCSGGRFYTIVITCPTITVNPSTLPDGRVGTAYSSTSITGSGGTAPYTYTVSAGALPTPLLLDLNTGAITGTPGTAGLYSFTIRATDANGCFGERAYSNVRICANITLATVDSCAVQGTAYSSSAAASGGSGTYTYAIGPGSLPPPLGINPSTGAITGTPNAAGSYNFTVTATEAVTGCTGSQAYTINVLHMTPAAGALPDATFGTLYTQNLTATGGISFTYALTLGTLPGGVSLTGNQITGTPSGATGTGDFSFTITATNTTTGCTVAKAYTLKSRPVAVNNTYTDGAGNTEYYAGGFATPTTPFVSSATNILTNDLGPGLTATIVTQPANGTVTLNSGGSFRYTPNAGANTSASFTYKVTSNGVDSAANATVTITLVGRVWYVNSAAGVGSGTSNSPFNTLNAADVPSTTNDIVFVHTGGATTPGSITLDAGQVLWGQGTAFALGGSGLAIGAATKPNLTGTITLGGSNITISSLDIATSTGTALSDNQAGAITGISVINSVTIAATNFPAVVLSDVTTAAAGIVFSSLSSSNSDTTGVSLTNVNGTFTGSAGSITTAGGTDFFISGGTANVTYAGTITDDVGQLVNVTGTTGGTKAFSGAISDGPTADTGSGISLTSNGGATIAFTGGLSLSTGANTAFTATGGGTVTATQNNTSIVNTLTTTTGTALNVANTTIGASGLTFRRISSNGATNGIVLNNTGATAGLTVSGNGGACSSVATCTGGTIQTAAVGISLTSTLNPSFDRMFISTTTDSGINGTTVTNFTFTNGKVDNTGNAGFDSAIAFNTNPTTANNIAGTLTITGNTLTNAFYSGLDIQSGDGTITNANVSNNTITNTTLGAGINFVGTGTPTTVFKVNKATVNQNNLSNIADTGIQFSVGSSATGPGAVVGIANDAANLISITNNSVLPAANSTQAITVSVVGLNSAQRSTSNFDMSCNGKNTGGCTSPTATPLGSSSQGTVLLVGNNGFANMSGVVNNNAIVATHTPNLGGGNGIAGGNGVGGAGSAWTPILKLTVTNNSITGTDGNGILLVGRGTSGFADMKISNNTVTAPVNAGGTSREGIRVDAGNAASTDDGVCVTIASNTSAGSNGAAGIGIRKQGTLQTTNDFGITGLAPSPATGAQAAAFVVTQNPAGGGVDNISGSNFQSCATAPPIPPPFEGDSAGTSDPGSQVTTPADQSGQTGRTINPQPVRLP